MGSTQTDPDRNDPLSPDQSGPFVAIVSERADGEKTCTISPWPTSEYELLSEWVSARTDSFVSLEEIQ